MKTLRRVLAGRAAAKVRVDDQNRGALVLAHVEGMAVVRMYTFLAVVFEHVGFEPFEADAPEESGRHDPIGVDVVATQWQSPAADCRDGAHQSTSSRTSVTTPSSAAAATMAGLI